MLLDQGGLSVWTTFELQLSLPKPLPSALPFAYLYHSPLLYLLK